MVVEIVRFLHIGSGVGCECGAEFLRRLHVISRLVLSLPELLESRSGLRSRGAPSRIVG